jgi:hypothetical protein
MYGEIGRRKFMQLPALDCSSIVQKMNVVALVHCSIVPQASFTFPAFKSFPFSLVCDYRSFVRYGWSNASTRFYSPSKFAVCPDVVVSHPLQEIVGLLVAMLRIGDPLDLQFFIIIFSYRKLATGGYLAFKMGLLE